MYVKSLDVFGSPAQKAVVRELKLLEGDTPIVFDRLVRLAAGALQGTGASVKITHGTHAHFVSAVGLPGNFLKTKPITPSFWGKLLEQGALSFPNLNTYRRREIYHAVGVQSMACVLLRTSAGVPLGAVCVYDTQPRPWTQAEMDLLHDLAVAAVTELELRANLRRSQVVTLFEQLLEGASDMILVKGPGSRILWANRAFRDYYGMSLDELRGIIDAPFVEPDQTLQYVMDDNHVFLTGKSLFVRQEPVTRYDGEIRLMETMKSPLVNDDGEVEMILCVSRDVTDRVNEAGVMRSELAAERERNMLKNRLTSMISHEFRNPLTVVLSSSGLLQDFFDVISPEKRRYHLSQIDTQVRRLVALLDEILMLGKMEHPEHKLRRTDIGLREFVRNCIRDVQATAQDHTLTFTTEGTDDRLQLDVTLMRQVFDNLLTNAVKYSPDGGEVRVHLDCCCDTVRIEVSDDGIGIPKQDLPRLFEPFYRAGNIRQIPGTGLGLAIVKRCVELHGGRIFVESEIGHGTTFTIELPRTSPATPPIPFLPDAG